MTNLEGLRLLSAKGMAKFIAEERLKILAWLCEEEPFRPIFAELGYTLDINEMRERLEDSLCIWLEEEVDK